MLLLSSLHLNLSNWTDFCQCVWVHVCLCPCCGPAYWSQVATCLAHRRTFFYLCKTTGNKQSHVIHTVQGLMPKTWLQMHEKTLVITRNGTFGRLVWNLYADMTLVVWVYSKMLMELWRRDNGLGSKTCALMTKHRYTVAESSSDFWCVGWVL